MEWRIENGGYPYLDGIVRQAGEFTAPYPLTMWRCTAGSCPDHGWLTERPVLGCFANAEDLRTFLFMGTAAQWESMERGTCWNANAPFDRVVCTDGIVLTG